MQENPFKLILFKGKKMQNWEKFGNENKFESYKYPTQPSSLHHSYYSNHKDPNLFLLKCLLLIISYLPLSLFIRVYRTAIAMHFSFVFNWIYHTPRKIKKNYWVVIFLAQSFAPHIRAMSSGASSLKFPGILLSYISNKFHLSIYK